MQRIKINLPQEFSFSTTVPVRITDINYGGHVGNDSFLSLIHEARIQFLHHFGYSELNFENTSLIMTDVALEFKHELNYGDTVKISVTAADFDKLGFDIFYLLELVKDEQTFIAGKAKTGMLCFNYKEKRKAAIPQAAIDKLSSK
ncbi:MAG: thioesterase family protein [Chitinophagaceae bacterium]|nr:thioesterase family protein [Chitinophagaceae bacterium]MCW5905341.1 thioesterase family protein [Chitinophagaceae bacterium]